MRLLVVLVVQPQRHPICHRDSIIYAATCYKLGGKVVALKVYERSKLSSSKMRAIRREISIMNYVTQKKYVVLDTVDTSCVSLRHHTGSHGPSSFTA